MKSSLGKEIEYCSALYNAECKEHKWRTEWNGEMIYHSAVMAGSELTGRENEIVMGRNIIKGTLLYKRKPDDCEINFRLRRAYLLVNEYVEKGFDITPGRMKKLLDILLIDGLDEDLWGDYLWYINQDGKRLRNELDRINHDRELAMAEMTPLERYVFSFEVFYKFTEILHWENVLPKGGGVDSLARLMMYWIQRENGLLPVIIHSYRQILNPLVYMTDERTEDGPGLQEYKKVMLKQLKICLKKYLRGKGEDVKTTSRERILQLIAENPRHTAKTMAAILDITEKGVRKQISILKAENRLKRVGPDKGGKWKIVK